MAKISKEAAKRHNEAMALVGLDRDLTMSERWFVLENYNEAATNLNSLAGAFFTPIGLASDFSIELHGGRTVDLCAGIGCLSFIGFTRGYLSEGEMVCVELNTEYVRVGKKLLPEATWILGDITDEELVMGLGRFNHAIGNPPFGRVKSNPVTWAGYSGPEFEYKAIAVGSRIAKHGTFIIPQMSAGFEYSGTNDHKWNVPCAKLEVFKKQTGLGLEMNCGIDTECHKDDWRGVSPKVEIVECDYANVIHLEQEQTEEDFNLPQVIII